MLSGGPRVVLLVEDDRIILEYARLCLEEEGFTVLSASSAEGALALWDEFKGKVDLLVTDVGLPKMSGLELAMHVRRRDPQLQVLFVSGSDNGYSRDVLGDCAEFIQKPYSPEVFVQTVLGIIANAK